MNLRSIKKTVKHSIPSWIFTSRLKHNIANTVLFTFDDGPSESITPHILQILSYYKIKAIFFIVGNRTRKSNYKLLEEIINDGHIIGNHTFTHPVMKGLSLHSCINELRKCNNLIEDITGAKTTVFRPPQGIVTLSNWTASRKLGLRTILWSTGGGEYSFMRGRTAKEIAEQLLINIQSKDIILLHDNHKDIPDVLNIILPKLQEKGIDVSRGLNSLFPVYQN